MSAVEALVVTVLGMTVVFVGLVSCIAAIEAFRLIAARVPGEGGPTAPRPIASPAVAGPAGVVAPDVLAVIAAVLEVERALYVGRYRSRLTLRRAVPAAPEGQA